MDHKDTERREFFRLNFKAPVQFRYYAPQSEPKSAKLAEGLMDGQAKNISAKGVLFQTEKYPPQLSSIVWMSLDIRTLKICREIEAKALIFNDGILGKVVRVEEDSEKGDTYDIGICFLRNDERHSSDIRKVLSKMG